MGTVFAVRVDDDIDPAIIEGVFAWWEDVEDRFSTFRPTSQISRIGTGELTTDEADPDVRDVLSMCEELAESTGRRFSIRPGRPDGPGIDPAGYVKGWSVDEAGLILRVAGAENFIIYAGGDVLCAGRPSDEEAWRVGVRLPDAPNTIGAVVSLNRGAVASSGEYERGSHIWGQGIDEGSVLGVTVVGPELGIADALATALFADQAHTMDWLHAYPDYDVVLFDANRGVRWSERLGDRIEIPGKAPGPGSTSTSSVPDSAHRAPRIPLIASH